MLTDSCSTKLQYQRLSRTCEESKEGEEATALVFVANLLLSCLAMSDPQVYEPEQIQLFPVPFAIPAGRIPRVKGETCSTSNEGRLWTLTQTWPFIPPNTTL